MGKDVSTFNLHRASEEAANFQKNKLVKAYLTTGNLLQRRHALKLFLTDKRITEDTKSIIGIVGMDKETIAALQMLRSFKMMLNKIFRNCKWGRISNNKRAIVNVLSACILNGGETNQLSVDKMGKQAGLLKGFTQYNKN